MGLNPRKINSMLKGELRAAGIRWQAPGQARWEPSPLRDQRKVPTPRAAARTGVLKYYDYDITTCRTFSPDRVELPLQMHIGAPCVPLAAPGGLVALGDLIAQPPENALGACIHASLSGRVESVGERIVIVRQ